MTIAQRITDIWPVTEAHLLEKQPVSYPRAKTRAIEDAIYTVYALYGSGSVAPSLIALDATATPPLAQEIADRATLALIPMAKDAYKEGTTNRSRTQQFAGSQSDGAYDKLEALDELATTLKENIAKRQTVLAETLRVVAPTTQPAGVAFARPASSSLISPASEAKRRRGY